MRLCIAMDASDAGWVRACSWTAGGWCWLVAGEPSGALETGLNPGPKEAVGAMTLNIFPWLQDLAIVVHVTVGVSCLTVSCHLVLR